MMHDCVDMRQLIRRSRGQAATRRNNAKGGFRANAHGNAGELCTGGTYHTVITVYAQKIELGCTVCMCTYSTYSTCSECSTEVII